MSLTGDPGRHRAAGGAHKHRPPTTTLIREINGRVLEIGATFDAEDEDRELDFLCECGCLARVEMKPSEYAAQGYALLDGHRLDGGDGIAPNANADLTFRFDIAVLRRSKSDRP